MLKTVNLGLQYGSRKLFEHVDITFTKGNCYGIIGANGAGKSTFLKLLSGEIESTTGEVVMDKNERMSVLKQDQNAYNNETVVNTVLLGHGRLVEIMKEKVPKYMVPNTVIKTKQMPYNQNGKIDRAWLKNNYQTLINN